MEKLYSDMSSIAEFFNVTRMQIYRWSRIIPLPQWHWGYGIRRRKELAWTEQLLIDWRDKVRTVKLGNRRHGRRAYKLWRQFK